MKVSELEGAELDYWVASAEGWQFHWSKHNYYVITGPNGESEMCWERWSEYDAATGKKNKIPHPHTCMTRIGYFPSTNWYQGGPLIQKYEIPNKGDLVEAMREIVRRSFGDEVE